MKTIDKSGRRAYIRQLFRNNRGAFFLSCLTTILIGGINLLLNVLIKEMTDTISGVEGALGLTSLALLAAGLIVGVVMVKLTDYFAHPRFCQRALLQYKGFVFRRLMNKSVTSFRKESTAAYISALSNDVATIEQAILEDLKEIIFHVFMFVGAFSLMLIYSPLLTLAAVALTSLPLLVSMLAGNRLKEAERRVSDQNGHFTGMVKDCLTGFPVVKSFQAEGAMESLFAEGNGALEEAKLHRRKVRSAIGIFSSAAGAAAQLGVFLVGTGLALSGRGVTAGVVLAFVNLMNFVIMPVGELPRLVAGCRASLGLVDKLAGALEENVREEGEQSLDRLERGIELRQLSFGYEADKMVLRDVTTTFEAGRSYAVVGASGSGKSTLLELLMGGHEGYTGEMRFDGREVRDLRAEALFGMTSVIQQNVFVFNASIRDNITMFQSFPKEEVDRAIRLSGLAPVIEEKGEDYLCGENGSGLSGGERQRISIARALLRKSSLMLVDEATAALDRQTSRQVMDAILGLDGVTRVVVTHALEEEQLRRYDRILVLRDGRIEEEGGFEQLMESGGYFYSLYTVAQAA